MYLKKIRHNQGVGTSVRYADVGIMAVNSSPHRDLWVSGRLAKVRAVTSEDLLATARKYLDSGNMQIVLVGDRAQIESQAALFGDLEISDAQGNPLV